MNYSPADDGGAVLHGEGFHFDASGSRLNCDEVMKSVVRYVGSRTIVKTVR